MGEIYGLGSFAAADQLAVLDAAAENGFKVQYDMTNPGIQLDGGGPFDNDTALHWLRSNVTLVRNHKALLGYYICTRHTCIPARRLPLFDDLMNRDYAVHR